ncbi:MAG: hypothetical protein QOD51_753 [Candidatus Eremiobacteraeota bacterium]|nr:hypothetical protein [Candidatus Eremiobacteraeota bacterium]
MADKDKDKDPLSLWRDMLSQWETNVNALANRTMASDEYSSQMNGAMGATLRMQETMRDFMAQYLAATNLPSRKEVLGIAERLGTVEARLDRITTLLERIADAQLIAANSTPVAGDTTAPGAPAVPPRARPPRTKSPPKAEPTA